jgi:hypothetical protein
MRKKFYQWKKVYIVKNSMIFIKEIVDSFENLIILLIWYSQKVY